MDDGGRRIRPDGPSGEWSNGPGHRNHHRAGEHHAGEADQEQSMHADRWNVIGDGRDHTGSLVSVGYPVHLDGVRSGVGLGGRGDEDDSRFGGDRWIGREQAPEQAEPAGPDIGISA